MTSIPWSRPAKPALYPHGPLSPSHPGYSVSAWLKHCFSIYDTFGHRYLAISFMIAQSAFLCSLLDTVCSVSKASVFGGPFGLAAAGFCTLSGFTLPRSSSLDVVCVSFFWLEEVLQRDGVHVKCRAGKRLLCHGGSLGCWQEWTRRGAFASKLASMVAQAHVDGTSMDWAQAS